MDLKIRIIKIQIFVSDKTLARQTFSSSSNAERCKPSLLFEAGFSIIHRRTYGRSTTIILDHTNMQHECNAKELVFKKCEQSEPLEFEVFFSKE